MLASINPLGERSRNQRYWMTVVVYIIGSTVAGAFLGGTLGLVGAPVALPIIALAVVAVLAIVGIMFDARAFGTRVPGPRRQVAEDWLVTYRGLVYGGGFGAEVGYGRVSMLLGVA